MEVFQVQAYPEIFPKKQLYTVDFADSSTVAPLESIRRLQ
jgi:hypothetical protein